MIRVVLSYHLRTLADIGRRRHARPRGSRGRRGRGCRRTTGVVPLEQQRQVDFQRMQPALGPVQGLKSRVAVIPAVTVMDCEALA